MRFASSLSTHPVTAHATGEVIGQVIEQVGRHPDLAVVYVTRPHAGALDDAADTVARLLEPSVLIGCAAESVVGNQREIENAPAVSLWAGMTGPIVGVRLWTEFEHGGPGGTGGPGAGTGEPQGSADPRGETEAPTAVVAGWPDDLPFEPQALLLLADPYSFAVDVLLQGLHREYPGLPVLGGMASAAFGPGGNRLVLNHQVFTDGAVGAIIGPGVTLRSVVSQGCRPIGRPLAVTRAERNIIYELAGQPALHRLIQMAKDAMSERDVQLINQGLHMGLVIDEHKAEFSRGDFLIRNVIGADRANGAIAIGDEVEVGTTVQFHVRDAESADEDLREMLADRHAEGVLLFTCNGRGTRLFDEPDHDAGVIGDLLGDPPVAGFFAAGEIGPVGGNNFVHGFTASMALFEERLPSASPSPSQGSGMVVDG
ncbi:MAG TPA: FIST N-terminal domain-containing protein [Acidimicrobiales bacterium]|nr:FIST N-terminal domain-containing protein [Acidimicrobiales bacterium]